MRRITTDLPRACRGASPGALPLQQTFKRLREELLDHMSREDRVLFPVIVALEAGDALPGGSRRGVELAESRRARP